MIKTAFPMLPSSWVLEVVERCLAHTHAGGGVALLLNEQREVDRGVHLTDWGPGRGDVILTWLLLWLRCAGWFGTLVLEFLP